MDLEEIKRLTIEANEILRENIPKLIQLQKSYNYFLRLNKINEALNIANNQLNKFVNNVSNQVVPGEVIELVDLVPVAKESIDTLEKKFKYQLLINKIICK